MSAPAKPARRSPRWVIVLAFVFVVALGAFFGIRAIWNAATSHFSSNGCTIGDYSLDTDQAVVAAQMVGEVTRFRPQLPDRAAVLVLAAALQESKLTNLLPNQGDRDSVGVLQQRPSQGWGGGDAAKLNDVTEATREFLDALVKHQGWQKQPLATAINDVQVSAYASLYTQHEAEATVLATAFLGRKPAAVNCSFSKPTVVAAPAKVASELRAQLPVNRPRVAGPTVRVPGAGWQTAAWFVANADRLGIDSVGYHGRRWSRTDGWTHAPAPRRAVVATMAKV